VRKEFLVFGSPLIEQAEIDEVVASMRSGWLGTGPKVAAFEQSFSQYKGCRHAIALSSCTAALHVALLTLGIRPGDEVILPTMTFAATANAVVHAGGIPVFVDCDRRTFNIEAEKIAKCVSPKTKAIIPVHFAGRPCDMDTIMAIAGKHGLFVIEDCAHAIEAEYRGRKVGTIGDIGCFSFHATKNITTGEGGMLVTENEDIAAQAKILSMHGLSQNAWQRYSDDGFKHYDIVSSGFKYNMMDLQAAIGIHQLKRIESRWRRRQEIWQAYCRAFERLPVETPVAADDGTRPAYHLFTLLLETDSGAQTRDGFLDAMQRRNIGVGVHYVALHLHPYYQRAFGYKDGDFPDAEWVSARTVSLPLSPKLSQTDVADVIDAVRDCVAPRAYTNMR